MDVGYSYWKKKILKSKALGSWETKQQLQDYIKYRISKNIIWSIPEYIERIYIEYPVFRERFLNSTNHAVPDVQQVETSVSQKLKSFHYKLKRKMFISLFMDFCMGFLIGVSISFLIKHFGTYWGEPPYITIN